LCDCAHEAEVLAVLRIQECFVAGLRERGAVERGAGSMMPVPKLVTICE